MMAPGFILDVTEPTVPWCVVSVLGKRGEGAVDVSSEVLTSCVVSKITDVFSGVPVAFMVLLATVVFLWNTVELSGAFVAFSVDDVASSGRFVDFAATCVIFSLADVV